MTPHGASPIDAAHNKPYKGPDSYQPEDADLFFGRNREAEQVIARILSSAFSVLHAPSGAGKTSLLNARIIPGLESRGWLPFRVLPQDDPSEAVRATAFRDLLSSPRDEAIAIDRVCTAFATNGTLLTLGDAIGRYDTLRLRDSRRRDLVAPIEGSDASAPGTAFGGSRIMPFFARLLRGSLDAHRYAEHLTAICDERPGFWQVEEDTDLRSLSTLLRDPAREAGYRKLVNALQVPVPGLRPFFENWWDVLGSRFESYSVVLIFDQFEELFTRFADPGLRGHRRERTARAVLHWQIRDDFVAELGELYAATSPSALPASAGGTRDGSGSQGLPLRIVVALRDEYIAHLDPIRRVVWDLDSSAFHLDMLLKKEAAEAITEPAKEYGYRYADACFADIVAKLAREDRFVEPAHLQIVCERLWNERGMALAQGTAAGPTDDVPEIDFDTYQRFGGAPGILRTYIDGFLASLTPEDRLEALDILEPLITGSGTRNIVEWTQLVAPPMRDAERREQLLRKMQKYTIVRVEWRLGGLFVEITHEFLIEPVLRAIRQEVYGAGENARFIQARRALDSVRRSDFRSDPQLLLTARDLQVLHKQRQRLKWAPIGLEIMLRSAIIHGPDSDKAMLYLWARHYAFAVLGEELPPDCEALASEVMPVDQDERLGARRSDRQVVQPTLSLAEIVGSYIVVSSPAIQANAVRTLAALDDMTCVRTLAQLASDDHSSVREVAQAQILTLRGQSAEWAKAALIEALHRPKTADVAYSLLGRWHGTGLDLPALDDHFLRRLRLAARAGPKGTFQLYQWHGWPQLGPCIVWTFIGVLFTGLLATITFAGELRSSGITAMQPLGISLAVLTPLFALVATRRSGGIQFYPDQSAGTVVELWRSARSVLFPVPLALILAAVILLASNTMKGPAFGLLSLCIAVLVVGVRAGTLVAYEAFGIDPSQNRLFQSLNGAAIGLAVCGGACWLMMWVFQNRAMSAAVATGAYLMAPVTFGLARAYSAIDRAAPPQRPILGVWSRRLSLAASAVFIWLLCAAVMAATLTIRARRSFRTIQTLPATWTNLRLPSQVRFVVPPTQNTTDTAIVYGGIPRSAGSDFTLQLTNSRGQEIDRSDFPSAFEFNLPPDTYTVAIRQYDASDLGAVALQLLRRLSPPGLFSDRSTERPFDFRMDIAAPGLRRARENARAAQRLAASSGALSLDSAARKLSIAVGLIEAAISTDSTKGATPDQLNDVCWEGTLAGLADHVLHLCERAVALGRDAPYIIDSRGLARALTGDRAGAIRDFQVFAKAGSTSDEDSEIRRDWIERLRRGQLTVTEARRSLGRDIGPVARPH